VLTEVCIFAKVKKLHTSPVNKKLFNLMWCFHYSKMSLTIQVFFFMFGRILIVPKKETSVDPRLSLDFNLATATVVATAAAAVVTAAVVV
jgi:hypothetical protein